MKKSLNQTRELYNILLAIFGEDKRNLAIHATINDIHYDRWGVYANIVLLNGKHIVGRLSRNHKFNGKVDYANYRSYRA